MQDNAGQKLKNRTMQDMQGNCGHHVVCVWCVYVHMCVCVCGLVQSTRGYDSTSLYVHIILHMNPGIVDNITDLYFV